MQPCFKKYIIRAQAQILFHRFLSIMRYNAVNLSNAFLN